MSAKHFVVALGVGVVIGGAVALLYAPQTGPQARKKLKRNFDDLSDTIEDAAEYLKDQAEHLAKEAEKFIEASKEQFGDVVDSANAAVKTVTKAARPLAKLV